MLTRSTQSFIIATLPYTALAPPLLLAFFIRPLSFNNINYLPAGPTALIFAILAQFHSQIPHTYKYRISTSWSTPAPGTPPDGIVFSDKSYTYLLAAQLALSHVPGSLISAGVGWVVGYAWRNEILPGANRWRVPGWVGREKKEGAQYEGLRRRLEGEAEATASGAEGSTARGDGAQRRPLGSQILDQFR
jgi:hypothetical protein